MKAPEHERMELLRVAIGRATDALNAPLDRVDVANARVNCRAGRRQVAMAYADAPGGRTDPVGGVFRPIPLGGSWGVVVVEAPVAQRPRLTGNRLAKLVGRLG